MQRTWPRLQELVYNAGAGEVLLELSKDFVERIALGLRKYRMPCPTILAMTSVLSRRWGKVVNPEPLLVNGLGVLL